MAAPLKTIFKSMPLYSAETVKPYTTFGTLFVKIGTKSVHSETHPSPSTSRCQESPSPVWAICEVPWWSTKYFTSSSLIICPPKTCPHFISFHLLFWLFFQLSKEFTARACSTCLFLVRKIFKLADTVYLKSLIRLVWERDISQPLVISLFKFSWGMLVPVVWGIVPTLVASKPFLFLW